jgi:hypothetical protein
LLVHSIGRWMSLYFVVESCRDDTQWQWYPLHHWRWVLFEVEHKTNTLSVWSSFLFMVRVDQGFPCT